MNIEKRKKETVRSQKLSQLKSGDVFHFSYMPFEDALKEDDIYMTVAGGKDTRVQIVNLSDGLLLMRDGTHPVCKLSAGMILDV